MTRNCGRNGGEFLNNLTPFPASEQKNTFLIADLKKPTDVFKNSENVENYGIYPFGVFGLGLPQYDRAKNTFFHRQSPYMWDAWEPAAIVAARLGLADEAHRLTVDHCRCNMFNNNGARYSPAGTVFVEHMISAPYFDSAGVCASRSTKWPCNRTPVCCESPRRGRRPGRRNFACARGGFMVVGEVDRGRVSYALIESQWGGPCKLANPWSETVVVRCQGREILRSDAPVLRFATDANCVYRVERAAEPVAQMAFAPLAPSPNVGVKRFADPPNVNYYHHAAYLGIDAHGQTPQRLAMEQKRDHFRKELASITHGLTDLSTGKAAAGIAAEDGILHPASQLVDGVTGWSNSVEMPSLTGCVVVDLRAEHPLGADCIFDRSHRAGSRGASEWLYY